MIRVDIEDDFGTTLEYRIATSPDNPNYHHWGVYHPTRDQWSMGRIYYEGSGRDLVWRVMHMSCNSNFKQWSSDYIEDHLAFADNQLPWRS